MEENHLINPNNVHFMSQQQELNKSSTNFTSCGSMDSIFDALLRDTTTTPAAACTEKTGPLSSENSSQNHDDSTDQSNEHYNGRQRGWERGGNREAVRKYRQKKKAHTVSLTDELVKLRALNQQLMQRVQSQATLETEVARLKCLLVDIRGRIEGEIGSFPYQKAPNNVNSLDNVHHNFGDTSFSGSSNKIIIDAPSGDRSCLNDGMSGGGVIAFSVQNLDSMGSFGSPPSLS